MDAALAGEPAAVPDLPERDAPEFPVRQAACAGICRHPVPTNHGRAGRPDGFPAGGRHALEPLLPAAPGWRGKEMRRYLPVLLILVGLAGLLPQLGTHPGLGSVDQLA